MPKVNNSFNVRTRICREEFRQTDLYTAETLFAQLAVRYLLLEALLNSSCLVDGMGA